MSAHPETAHFDSLPRFSAPASGALDAAMQRAFAAAGVLILDDFVSRDACAELKDRAGQLIDAFDPAEHMSVFSTSNQAQYDDRYFIESGDKIRFFFEDGAFDSHGRLRQSRRDSLNKIGHALHDRDPAFSAFSRTPQLAAAAASLGLDDAVIIQSMYILKPPRIGGEVVCHQDSTYIYTEPESCTGFWFALEDATVENGCMYFIPGQHTGPLKARNRRRADGTLVNDVLDTAPWPESLRLPAEAAAGALVIFSGRAPHMSGPNRSSRSRHAYTLHAIDRRCHYPADNWLQRDPALPLRGFA